MRKQLSRHATDNTKPGRHLTQLRSLADFPDRDSGIVRELWLQAIPVHIQSMLMALLEGCSPNRVAPVACKFVSLAGSWPKPSMATKLSNRSDVHRVESTVIPYFSTCLLALCI